MQLVHLLCSPFDLRLACGELLGVSRDWSPPTATGASSAKEATELAKSFASALKGCQEAQRTLNACKDDEECARASLALTVCMGKIMCPLQHDALTKRLAAEPTDAKGEAEYNARVDAALENIAVCVASSNERASIAKRTHPEAFA